jgi:hypothetical protein
MKTTLALAITTALAIAHGRVCAEQLAGGLEFHSPTGLDREGQRPVGRSAAS